MMGRIAIFLIVVGLVGASVVAGAQGATENERLLPSGVKIIEDADLAGTGGLGGAPSRVELSDLEPGEEIASGEGSQLTVHNRTDDTMELVLRPVDLDAEPGATSFAAVVEDARFGAAQWIELAASSLVLLPGDRAVVPVFISVPDDAAPGSMYAGVQIAQEADELGQATATGIRGSLVLQYLFDVGGDLVYEGEIVDVEQPRLVERTRGSFARIGFTYRNKGNATDELQGRIRFQSTFGNSVADIELSERLVMREAELSVREIWTDPPWIGRFVPVIELQGRGGRTHERELEPIWVVPPLIYILLVLLALAIPVTWHWRNRRRWRRTMERLSHAEAVAAAAADAGHDDYDEYDELLDAEEGPEHR